MIGLTTKQARAVETIRKLTRGGRPPSYREIGEAMGLKSLAQVHQIIHGLKDRGALEFGEGRSRSLRLKDDVTPDLQGWTTPELRHLRDQIDRELRRRAWG